jgi:hypothetical protein
VLVIVPPSDVHRDLQWKKQDANVEIDVDREATFKAHDCLLAMRSPVLEAELLAAAKEKVLGDTVRRHMELFAPDSESLEVVPDSESLVVVPNSLETKPGSLPPAVFICARCHLVHEDHQAWDCAHSCLWPCSCCGLVHNEYMVLAMFYGFNEFDCEVFIPKLDNMVIHGNNVKFDEHVLNKLNQKRDQEITARKVMFMQRSNCSCCNKIKKFT